MRIPVVSTPISGIVELVEHMKNGLLAPEKDFEAVAAAMEMLLDNPALRERLGENGRQKVMAQFSLDQSTAKLRRFFVGEGPPRGRMRTRDSQVPGEAGLVSVAATEQQPADAARPYPAFSEEAPSS